MLAEYSRELVVGAVRKAMTESWLDLRSTVRRLKEGTNEELRKWAEEYDKKRHGEMKEDHREGRKERRAFFAAKKEEKEQRRGGVKGKGKGKQEGLS